MSQSHAHITFIVELTAMRAQKMRRSSTISWRKSGAMGPMPQQLEIDMT
jgi:hypothetical protein